MPFDMESLQDGQDCSRGQPLCYVGGARHSVVLLQNHQMDAALILRTVPDVMSMLLDCSQKHHCIIAGRLCEGGLDHRSDHLRRDTDASHYCC